MKTVSGMLDFFMRASCTFKAAIMRSMRRCSIMRGAMGSMADHLGVSVIVSKFEVAIPHYYYEIV